jgi:putative addiction module killer protein
MWAKRLDGSVRGRITARITRIEDSGNFGDWKSVGDGVFELRLDFGPGYRVYFGEDPELDQVVLLLGGDKDTQVQDIAKAQEYWRDYNA